MSSTPPPNSSLSSSSPAPVTHRYGHSHSRSHAGLSSSSTALPATRDSLNPALSAGQGQAQRTISGDSRLRSSVEVAGPRGWQSQSPQTARTARPASELASGLGSNQAFQSPESK